MATRGELRDGVYSEMEAVAGTYDVTDSSGAVIDTVELSAENIGLRNPEQSEKLPQIVYHEDYRRLFYNGVGSGPDMIRYEDNGDVAEEVWREYMEAQFIMDVRASDETVKEPIYESMREQFGKYQFRPWSPTDIHSDVIDVEVLDSTTVDTGDTEDVIRGDQIEVRVKFFREYTFSTDTIQEINTQVDADDDGTTDVTFTTSN